MQKEYDFLIVGARAAGAPLAIHLSRAGHKVLIVDKGKRGQDTLSTHFVYPRGASYLNRLGVLDRILQETPSASTMNVVMEGIRLRGEVPLALLEKRFERLHGVEPTGMQPLYFSARRKFIDRVLRDEAVKAGADLEEGFTVNELIFRDGRVTGVKGRDSTGVIRSISARVVIGADGRSSTVARLLSLPKIDQREACTFASYSYFTDTGLGNEAIIERKGRLALGISATNDGAHMILVYGPKDFYKDYARNTEGNFFKALREINPTLAEKVQPGRRMEQFYSTAEQDGFLRKAAGPGFALVGDAACFKDQCTASGMTHAFRDAELLAQKISPVMKEAPNDHERIDAALRDYQHRRYVDSAPYYDFVCQQAEMNPLRADELRLFESLQYSQEHIDRFLAMYGDTLSVRDFFSEQSVQSILKTSLNKPFKGFEIKKTYFENPFIRKPLADSEYGPGLTRNCADFATPVGPNLIKRTESYHSFYQDRMRTGTFQYSRTLKKFPGPQTQLVDDAGRSVHGINFASQDYLGLGAHPRIREAAIQAIHDFGPHSAGSPMVIGNTTLSQQLEKEVGEMLDMKHVLLYPTGFAAGYGSVAALVRAQDHIIMDRLSHSCLQNGAAVATKNIYRHPHLDAESVKAYLQDIRSRDVRNGILVITEGIFSMDADAPDLMRLQEVCHEYGATLLVDVAHDFGATGPNGTGQIGIQKMLGKIDLVMGSFSKSFASNGGFLATNAESVKHFAKMYGSSHMFSNALSPVQTATALTAARIMRTEEGNHLRAKLLRIATFLRDELAQSDLTCLGTPGPIVPVMIGSEKMARICHSEMQKRNLAVMILEYPVVAIGASRFRLQVMASHTRDDARAVAEAIRDTVGVDLVKTAAYA